MCVLETPPQAPHSTLRHLAARCVSFYQIVCLSATRELGGPSVTSPELRSHLPWLASQRFFLRVIHS